MIDHVKHVFLIYTSSGTKINIDTSQDHAIPEVTWEKLQEMLDSGELKESCVHVLIF